MLKAILRQNGFTMSTKWKPPNLEPLWRHLRFRFSPKFLSTSSSESDPHSFAVSYLINNCGFTSESALKASKRLRFTTSQKPDSVITFFRNHGFPDSDIYGIIRREPWLLSCDVNKRILPKFQFLLSKGASTLDLVRIATGDPRFMKSSFQNVIIPTYELINSFLNSDKKTLASVIYCPYFLSRDYVRANIKLLIDNGVSNYNISKLLRSGSYIYCRGDFGKTVQEIKNLGFCPSKVQFGDALLAKGGLRKSNWDDKIDIYKKWGWSEETISEAFRRQPMFMLVSNDKINRLMQFWVHQLGWDSTHLARAPGVFKYSLENNVIPRALVVHYLISKGLRSKSASLLSPFFMSEKRFLQKFVKCFKEEEISQILKLYQGYMNVEDKRALGNLDLLCPRNT